jgi:signal transduction histidine kinase
MLLNNLLSNALKHARGRIKVSVRATAHTAIVAVEDDGPGIPPSERDAVLEPFRRGSNSTGLPGHGMGLAIVARIARWLNATVHIADSATLGGAAVSLRLSLR